ncbi:unnamed protein product [Didymodactylos carnosus]|uniref:Uncharacterized protein n=1 Tax=Didymodactylos carnosus TaxID=1234261 RepID=A0A813PG52_9BILA|nr:unnamed protein product [Didymodactylos carnosus]CAF3534695.1 unnamed protein product [Didymodactylos carnosus]
MSTNPTISTKRHHYQQQLSTTQSLTSSFNERDILNTTQNENSIQNLTGTLVTLIFHVPLTSQDNQQLLLNSYASCRRLLNWVKEKVVVAPDDKSHNMILEMIDFMDNDGKLKELNTHSEEYATHYLVPRSTYYVLKIEVDNASGEKRYTAIFNFDQLDQKLCTVLTNSLNTLNSGKSFVPSKKRPPRLNTSAQSTTNATNQTRTKRGPTKKQTS